MAPPAAASAAAPAAPTSEEGETKAEDAEMEGGESQEEEKAKEKKPRAPRAKKAEAPVSAPVEGERSSRVRKATQVYVPPSPAKKSEEDFVIEEGPGTALGEIENIKHNLDKTQAIEAEVKLLFHCCFPHQRGGAAKGVVKKHIRAFSGYVPSAAKELGVRELKTRAQIAFGRARSLLYSHAFRLSVLCCRKLHLANWRNTIILLSRL
jgi:hypothetical protein